MVLDFGVTESMVAAEVQVIVEKTEDEIEKAEARIMAIKSDNKRSKQQKKKDQQVEEEEISKLRDKLSKLKIYKAKITDPLDVVAEINKDSAYLMHALHVRIQKQLAEELEQQRCADWSMMQTVGNKVASIKRQTTKDPIEAWDN